MSDRFSLLTWFPQRFGFNSCGLKSIGLVSSSAEVWRSRREFDRIQRLARTNPASIGSQLSLDAGKLWWTLDLAQKLLNCFTIQSRFKIQSKNISISKRNLLENGRPFDLMKPVWAATIARMRWPMILQRGPTFLLSFCPFDFNRTVVMPPRVTPRCGDFTITPKCPMFHLRNQQLHWTYVLLMTIGWNPVHTIDARYVDAIASNAHSATTCSAHLKSHGNIVPHGRKKQRKVSIKGGAAKCKCVTALIL